MFLLFAIGAIAALCALLWRVAIYALPVFVGFSAGFLSLSGGAGVGAPLVGLFAGVMSWEFAKYAFVRGNDGAKLPVLGLFALPAAYMGFEIVWQISATTDISLLWRGLLGVTASMAVGGTVLARLSNPHSIAE